MNWSKRESMYVVFSIPLAILGAVIVFLQKASRAENSSGALTWATFRFLVILGASVFGALHQLLLRKQRKLKREKKPYSGDEEGVESPSRPVPH